MFLARYNYEVVNGKMQKVKYNAEDILKDVNSVSDAELQNFLLDMYQGVLTSPDHSLSTATPLDVCTAPIKQFATKEIAKYQSGQEDGIKDDIDGFHLNPVFLNRNKKLNSGSDEGIGPMALNSTFQAHAQISKISMYDFPILKQLGISKLGDIFDKYGEEILDLNSGMINAFVDAAKDNYIGNVNVNGYTYDITSLMLALGFGTDTFALLTQPIIKEVAQNWLTYKNGLIGVSALQRKGKNFMQVVINRYSDLLKNIGAETKQADYKQLMEHDTLMNHLTPRYDNAQWLRDQLAYLEIFNELNTLAQEYHNAIANVQVDTKKYGVNINQLLSFIQAVDAFMSEYNIAFENPEVLYNNTFLGKKYELGVRGIFDVFKNVLPEFSDIYVNTANELSKRFGLYGRRSKEFLRVLGPKIKTVLYSKFFNEYLVENFGGTKPLAALTYGEKSVPGRYDYIRRKALMRNEGTALFEAIKYNKLSNAAVPQFMLVTSQFKENPDIKNNVQLALSELFNSADPEIRQWANDFAVYMFYVSGGTDSNAGGIIRTTIYDVIPPQFLSNLKAGGITFNQYAQDYIINRKGVMGESEINQVLNLLAISDDKYIPLIKKHGGNFSFRKVIGGDVIAVIKGSYSLFNYDTGTFKPFIKIATPNGYDLYKLGEQVPSVSKTGLVYTNPIYYRVNKIGYRSKARFAFSLRADGYITNTGQLRSLLWQSNTFESTSFSELDAKNKKVYMKNLNLTNENDIVDARGLIDYSDDYDPNSSLGSQQKAVVDKVDAIYLIVDDDFIKNSDVRSYAMFKGKEFHVISKNAENIPTANGDSIAIFGSNTDIAENIYQSNKDKQIYADTAVANSLSQHEGIVLNSGQTIQVLNQVATTTTNSDNTEDRVSNETINVYAGTGDNVDLSNFAVRPVKRDFLVKGNHGTNYITFNTVEGAFLATKLYHTDEILENPTMAQIKPFMTATGKQARAMGRNIKNLNLSKWNEISTSVLKQIMKDSFEQNPNAFARLLATGNAIITHKNASGKEQDNGRFSRLLMEIRDEFRSESKNIKLPEEQKGENIKNRCIVK